MTRIVLSTTALLLIFSIISFNVFAKTGEAITLFVFNVLGLGPFCVEQATHVLLKLACLWENVAVFSSDKITAFFQNFLECFNFGSFFGPLTWFMPPCSRSMIMTCPYLNYLEHAPLRPSENAQVIIPILCLMQKKSCQPRKYSRICWKILIIVYIYLMIPAVVCP